ncbi:MAG TPA: thiamine diphosphokinase [Burkholderiales bacterium]|nr:thiamine diphosphokinase [Burkholderiales bacterium]
MSILTHLIPNIKHISICANGLFPTDTEVIARLKNGSPIIACDGALNAMSKHGIVADFAIGDGDSLDYSRLQDFIKNPYIQIDDQNTNDLTKAINFIAENYGCNQSILIFAATGLREDHTLGNIALLEQYSTQFKQIAMLSDFGILEALPAGTHRLNSVIGQQISFFCFNQKTEISCEELKWPLVNKNFLALNHGTLNQATAAHINLESNGSVIVFRAFEVKC